MAALVALGKLKEKGHEFVQRDLSPHLAKIVITVALFTADPDPTPATVSDFCHCEVMIVSFLMTAK